MGEYLIEVNDLRAGFRGEEGFVQAVDGVSIRLRRGETLGIVGESGSGKSVTSLAIMGLIPQPPGVVTGEVRFDGRDLLKMMSDDLRKIRGDRISMIFQEPMTSLNPAFTIGEQIAEAILQHRPESKAQARQRAIEMLRRVRMPSPERRFDEFPHKLSGGMRQRAMIAMALACEPELLIADEPTTALDVTIQAQILDLLRELREQTQTAIILITHDLGVVAEFAEQVVVMYAGQIVEQAPVRQLFAAPEHPYTVGLLGSLPGLGEPEARLAAIEGSVPSPSRIPRGCRFAPRCPFAVPQCRDEMPALRQVGPAHWTRCLRAPLADLVE